MVGREVPRQHDGRRGLGRVQPQALSAPTDDFDRVSPRDRQARCVRRGERRCVSSRSRSAATAIAAHNQRGVDGGRAGDCFARSRSRSLEPLPADPSNKYADDTAAMRLGSALFFDTRLSGNGKVSCATCHAPDEGFPGRPAARQRRRHRRRGARCPSPERRTALAVLGWPSGQPVGAGARSARESRRSTAATARSTRT